MPLATSALEALLQTKLTALVREQWGHAEGDLSAFGGGAALVSGDRVSFILVHDADHRVLGGALAWALSRGATSLKLLVEGPGAGVASRRAAAFALPITVWQVNGRALAQAAPEPLPEPVVLPAEAAPFVGIIAAAGAEPVVELGQLRGEVLGLEVARLVLDDPDGPRLEVGVGRHDRQAHRMLFPNRGLEEGLAEVAAAVRKLRAPGVRAQLANTLAGERWLRAVVVAHPDLVGARQLAPVSPPVAHADLRVPMPAPAAGIDARGGPVLVVCSTGIDLDLVPAAADARLADGRDDVRLVLAVPAGDDHPRTRQLAAALRDPAEIMVVPADWRTLSATA